jgi:hypothetical protein
MTTERKNSTPTMYQGEVWVGSRPDDDWHTIDHEFPGSTQPRTSNHLSKPPCPLDPSTTLPLHNSINNNLTWFRCKSSCCVIYRTGAMHGQSQQKRTRFNSQYTSGPFHGQVIYKAPVDPATYSTVGRRPERRISRYRSM